MVTGPLGHTSCYGQIALKVRLDSINAAFSNLIPAFINRIARALYLITDTKNVERKIRRLFNCALL